MRCHLARRKLLTTSQASVRSSLTTPYPRPSSYFTSSTIALTGPKFSLDRYCLAQLQPKEGSPASLPGCAKIHSSSQLYPFHLISPYPHQFRCIGFGLTLYLWSYFKGSGVGCWSSSFSISLTRRAFLASLISALTFLSFFLGVCFARPTLRVSLLQASLTLVPVYAALPVLP